MELKLDRKFKKETYTIGKLYVNGVLFCDTVEDRDRGLTQSMSEAEIKKIKVYGQTAIPTGTYEVKMTYSPKFSKNSWGKKYSGKVPQVIGVKGFEGIRIHPGSNELQTSGCILPGKNLVKGKVLNSVEYYYKLIDNYILPAVNKGEIIKLVIV